MLAVSNRKTLLPVSHVLEVMQLWTRKDSANANMMMKPLTLRGTVWSAGSTGVKHVLMKEKNTGFQLVLNVWTPMPI